MDNTCSCMHPLHLSLFCDLIIPPTVPVMHLTLNHKGDRSKTPVGMWPQTLLYGWSILRKGESPMMQQKEWVHLVYIPGG